LHAIIGVVDRGFLLACEHGAQVAGSGVVPVARVAHQAIVVAGLGAGLVERRDEPATLPPTPVPVPAAAVRLAFVLNQLGKAAGKSVRATTSSSARSSSRPPTPRPASPWSTRPCVNWTLTSCCCCARPTRTTCSTSSVRPYATCRRPRPATSRADPQDHPCPGPRPSWTTGRKYTHRSRSNLQVVAELAFRSRTPHGQICC